MALNKLHVFNLTEYKKLLWMDGDTLVLKNVDHLFNHPHASMAITYACCNQNGPAIPSGGLWVIEPSAALGIKFWELMMAGKPKYTNGGDPVLGPDGKQEVEYWHWGDMQLVRWYFSKWNLKPERETLWPRIDDIRHGAVIGQRYFPGFANWTEERFAKAALADRWSGKPIWDGLDPSIPSTQLTAENMFGEVAPMW